MPAWDDVRLQSFARDARLIHVQEARSAKNGDLSRRDLYQIPEALSLSDVVVVPVTTVVAVSRRVSVSTFAFCVQRFHQPDQFQTFQSECSPGLDRRVGVRQI